ATVLGHTRWASVGMISQPNAHPVDSTETGAAAGPYVVAALNGDVENFPGPKGLDGLQIPPEIPPDAKVIPTLVSHRLAEGNDLTTAFRNTVASFEGSVAIAANAAAEPAKLLLALGVGGEAPAHPATPPASRGQIVVLDGSRAGTFEGIDRLAYDGTPLPVTEADVATAQITTPQTPRGRFPPLLL